MERVVIDLILCAFAFPRTSRTYSTILVLLCSRLLPPPSTPRTLHASITSSMPQMGNSKPTLHIANRLPRPKQQVKDRASLGSAIISNTNSTLLIYISQHIHVLAYNSI